LETQVNFEEPLTSQQIIQLVKEENAMLDCDKHAVETAEKKNELEAYIYDSKNKLNDVYSGYIDAEMKQFILNELDKTNQWLYGEGARASKGEYANKLEELKTLIQPLNERYKKGKTVMEALDDFSAKVTQFENKILPEVKFPGLY
jgi:Molecular chaperone